MNKKQFFFNLLYVALIVGLLIFMVWIVNFMKTDAKECMANPVVYFEEKNDGASCECQKEGIRYRFGNEELISSTNNFNINFTGIPKANPVNYSGDQE